MGFVCPECGRSFGNYKIAFDEHLQECRKGKHGDMLGAKEFLKKMEAIKEKAMAEVNSTKEEILQDALLKPQTAKRKRSVDLDAVKEAVEDGRISLWIDFDGDYHLKNNRSKKEVIITTEQNYFGETEEEAFKE